MAVSKIIYKASASATPETWMDVTQDTVTTSTLLSSYTATKNDGTKITGEYEGVSLQSKSATYTPTTSTQTSSILPDSGYALSSVGITVNPIPSAYIIPTGTLSISQNGSGIDVASYASVDVSVSGGGGGTAGADEIIQRTITGTYENSTVSVIASYAFYQYIELSAVSFPNCTSIGANAFFYCTALSAVSFPNCIQLDYGAFYSCSKLTTAYLPSISTINSQVFYNCKSLTDVTTAPLRSIGSSAFYSCTSLSSVNFSAYISAIGASAFVGTKLSALNLSHITDIGSTAFRYCTLLSEFTAGYVGFIRSSAFANCGLQRVSIIASSSIFAYGSSAFLSCTSLSSVYISQYLSTQYYYFAQGAFYGCENLKWACFTGVRSFIGSSTFYNCYNLLSLYILTRSTVTPTLGYANAFTNTPISTRTTSTGGVYGSIFVPASMYSSYIAATNWVNYSARFVSMTDAEIETFLSNLT